MTDSLPPLVPTSAPVNPIPSSATDHFDAVMHQLNRKYAAGQFKLNDLLHAVRNPADLSAQSTQPAQAVQPVQVTPTVPASTFTPTPVTFPTPITAATPVAPVSAPTPAPTSTQVATPAPAVTAATPNSDLRGYIIRLENHLKKHGRLMLAEYQASSPVRHG